MQRLVALALLAAACSPEDSFDRSAMLRDVVDEVVLFHNAALLTHAEALQTAAPAFCAAPTGEALTELRSSWTEVKRELKFAEAWGFGPALFFGIELSKNVDKWPGDPVAVEAIITGDDTLDAAYVDALDYRDRVKGYPAIEVLLFADADPDTAAATFTAVDGDRRCTLLTLLAEDGAAFLGAYAAEWEDGYGDELANAGVDSSAYPTEQDAVTAVVSGMLTATTQLSMDKLGMPMGDTTGGTADPSLAEAPHAELSREHALWVINGVRFVYEGDGGLRLTDLVRDREARGDVDGAVKARIEAARVALQGVTPSLEQAVVDDPAAVRAAIDAVDGLSISLSGELSTLLGINPTAVEGDND